MRSCRQPNVAGGGQWAGHHPLPQTELDKATHTDTHIHTQIIIGPSITHAHFCTVYTTIQKFLGHILVKKSTFILYNMLGIFCTQSTKFATKLASGIHLEPHVVICLNADLRVVIIDITASQQAVDSPHVGIMAGANRAFVGELQPLFGGGGETTVLTLYVLLEVACKL